VQETARERDGFLRAAGFCGALPPKKRRLSRIGGANPALNTKTARISTGASGGIDRETLTTTLGVEEG
jgi:hypothetical protein